jgi:Domain of unknown function (DUF4351)
LKARVNENSPIGFFTWCWTIVVEITDGRIGSIWVVAVPTPLRPYLPAFRHALVDLAATPDESLSAMARLRACLKALKYGRRLDLPERVDIILAEVAALGRRDLDLILTYLDKGPIAVSLEVIRQVLHRRVPEREEQIMGWLTQPYFEQGMQQGLAAGRAEGHAEGQAKSLVRLLEKRFGQLPAQLRERVFSADVQSLDTWFERAIDAADLQSVFAEPLTVRG